MSRAIRRHPSGKQGRQRSGRPPSMRPQPKQQQRETRQSRGLMRALRPNWAGDIISELGKVTWPSMEDTRYLTLVVLVVAGVFGIFLAGVDMFFNWAIENTLLRN